MNLEDSVDVESGDIVMRGGETFRVVRVDRRGVMVRSNTGTELIPPYEWPGAFESESGQATDLPVYTAMLIGGATGRHLDRIRNLAAELDIDIEYHLPIDLDPSKFPNHLPLDVDLVILLQSHIGHGAYWAGKGLAKKQGVPVATIPSAGFQHALDRALVTLELRSEDESYFGSTVQKVSDSTWYEWSGSSWVLKSKPKADSTWYEWTGSAWELRTASSSPVPRQEAPGEIDSFLALLLFASAVGAANR